MAHNIETNNGQHSFFSHNKSWHGLGTVVDNTVSWQEAIKLAHMDWTVKKVQLTSPVDGRDLDGAFGIFREDNNNFLGVVGSRYTPHQNEEHFKFLDTMLGADAHYEAAGVLGKGERVFAVVNLQQKYDIHGSGDIHKSYMLGCSSHDGSMTTTYKATDVRVVCQNTLTMALNEKGTSIRVKHTANSMSKLYNQLSLIEKSRAKFSKAMELYEELANRQLGVSQAEDIIKTVLKVGDEPSTRAANSVELVKELLEKNDGNTFKQFRGTAYNVLNAITEYTDHHRLVRPGDRQAELVRAETSLFGNASATKVGALELILEATENNKRINHHREYSILDQILENR